MIYILIFVNIVLLLLFDYRCLSFSLLSSLYMRGKNTPPVDCFSYRTKKDRRPERGGDLFVSTGDTIKGT